MSTLRCLLGIIGGASFAYAVTSLIPAMGLGDKDFGVAAAICAVCVLGIGLVRAIQTDHEADRERIRRGRAEVWARRDACGWPLCSFEPHECPEGRRSA